MQIHTRTRIQQSLALAESAEDPRPHSHTRPRARMLNCPCACGHEHGRAGVRADTYAKPRASCELARDDTRSLTPLFMRCHPLPGPFPHPSPRLADLQQPIHILVEGMHKTFERLHSSRIEWLKRSVLVPICPRCRCCFGRLSVLFAFGGVLPAIDARLAHSALGGAGEEATYGRLHPHELSELILLRDLNPVLPWKELLAHLVIADCALLVLVCREFEGVRWDGERSEAGGVGWDAAWDGRGRGMGWGVGWDGEVGSI